MPGSAQQSSQSILWGRASSLGEPELRIIRAYWDIWDLFTSLTLFQPWSRPGEQILGRKSRGSTRLRRWTKGGETGSHAQQFVSGLHS